MFFCTYQTQKYQAKRRILNKGTYEGSQLIMFSNIFFQNGHTTGQNNNFIPLFDRYLSSSHAIQRDQDNSNSDSNNKNGNQKKKKIFSFEDQNGHMKIKNQALKEQIQFQQEKSSSSNSQSMSSNSDQSQQNQQISNKLQLKKEAIVKNLFIQTKIIPSAPLINSQLPKGKAHRKSIFNQYNQVQSEDKSIHANKNDLSFVLNKTQQKKMSSKQNRVFNPKKANFLFDKKREYIVIHLEDRNKQEQYDFLSEEELIHEEELDMNIPANGSRRMNLDIQHNRRYSRMGLSKNNQLSLLTNKRLIWGSSLVSYVNKN